MLDDLKYIHQKDAQDALGIAEKQWQQLQHHYEQVDLSGIDFSKVQNVVVAGMGGSALAAGLVPSWPGLKVPLEVHRTYGTPRFAGPKTLFVASSYSGNTEEALDSLDAAEKTGSQIVIIASGGALLEHAQQKDYPFYQIPGGSQPRMEVLDNFNALVQLFEKGGLTEGTHQELHEAASWLSEQVKNFLPTVPASQNPAKKLAQELMGSSIVIYAGAAFYPAAYKWKINFNENAKNVAWCNELPEFNHNEILGWDSHPTEKPYKIVDIRSPLDHPQIAKRFEITERLLSGKRPSPEIVVPEGDTLLKQLLWTIQLGDFVSLYLALLNGLNPTPVDLIEKLKVALKE